MTALEGARGGAGDGRGHQREFAMFRFGKASNRPVKDYQDQLLVEVVFAKTIAFDDRAFSTLPAGAALDHTLLGVCYAAAVTGSRPLRVLDFGGACGFHHRVARHALADLPLQWAVVETPAMAARAAELATDLLQFFTTPGEATDWLGGIDLMHSSSAIQYTADPEGVTRQLCGLSARTLAWSRTALADGNTVRST